MKGGGEDGENGRGDEREKEGEEGKWRTERGGLNRRERGSRGDERKN